MGFTQKDYFEQHRDVGPNTYLENGVRYHVTPWGLLNDCEYMAYLDAEFGPLDMLKNEPMNTENTDDSGGSDPSRK